MRCVCTLTQQTKQQPPQWSSYNIKSAQSQEGGTKFTLPQVYLRSFLRSNPRCSCIHKNPRREKQHSLLPLPCSDICKGKQQQAIQDLEKQGKFHTSKKKKKRKFKDQIYTNRKIQSNNQFSLIIWMNFQTGSDNPIKICRSSKSLFSPTVWMNFQTGSDYSIEIWTSSKFQFSLTV